MGLLNSIAKVVIVGEDKTKGAFDALKAGARSASGAVDDVKSSAKGLNDAFDFLKRAAIVGAVGALAKEFVETGDKVSLLDARLKLVTDSQSDFALVQKDLIALSAANRMGLEETSQLYIKLADPIKRLGGGVRETEAVVDSFSKALKLGGANTEEAAAATLQFAQAMASGKLQGDEFKSLAETSPRLMKAMAEGMGVPIEKLKEMGSEGKLTAEVVGNALMKQKSQLSAEFATLPVTVGDSLTLIKNDWLVTVREIQQNTGINEALAGGLMSLRNMLPGVKQEISEAASSVWEWFTRMSEPLSGVFDQIKGIGTSLWETVKFAAGFFGEIIKFGVEWALQSNALQYSFIALRGLLAGVQDGVKIVGAAFAWAGSAILEYIIYPMSGFSDTVKTAAADAKRFASGIYNDFANGKTAVAGLADELQRGDEKSRQLAEVAPLIAKGQSDMGREANRAGISFDSQGKAVTATTESLKLLKNKTADVSKENDKAANKLKGVMAALKDESESLKISALAKRIYNEQKKAGVQTDSEAGLAIERLVINIGAEKRALDDARKAEEDRAKSLDSLKGKLDEQVEAIRVKVMESERESQTVGVSKSQIELLALARMRDKLAAMDQADATREITEARAYEKLALAQQIDLQGQLVESMRRGEVAEAMRKSAEDSAAAWKKSSDEISSSITDALMRGFESGKGFIENLKDTAVNAFKTMVLKPVISAVVNPMVGMATNAVGNVASSVGTSLFGSAVSAGLAASGGMSGLGAAFSTGMGLSMAEAGTAAAAYSGAGMGATGMALQAGSVFPPALAAMAYAYMMDQGLKGGWGGDNDKSGYALTWETGGLSVIGDKLFGHGATNADASGISGTLTAAGLQDGQSWQDFSQKGGTFSKDKRWTDRNAFSGDTASLISSQVVGIGNTAKLVAKVMGENITDGIASWKHDFNLQLSENGDLSKATEKITAEVGRAADSLAVHLFPSLTELALKGETAGATLLRVGQTFDVTNASALMLGRDWTTAFGEIGIASATARQQLVDMSGGVDALRNKLGAYYENYFTDTEKNQRSLEMLDAQFAAMGVRLELSKDAFKNFLEDPAKIDLTTEAGRKLYAGMLDLADPFSKLVESLGDGAAGKSVGSLASLLGEKSPIAENVKQAAADWWSKYGTAVEKQADQAVQIKAGLDNMATSLASLQQTLIGINQAAVAAQQATTAAITSAIAAAATSQSAAVVAAVEGAIESTQLR